ncbi:DUF4012 domain-containing protein [Nocardioides sp. HDW12B]|uniref:DUF4012 domain-containing protein n=1 Tax=Nocardioides sp. HDW12B TaxID=2714939 RepID=UPI00140C4EC1|nr:DUF4012 domain-containing protein [Nocardioides sp. HDW12B]QIK65371.1 DUF4012 domain-containing protein [Nocardioides sp. HDW12B]
MLGVLVLLVLGTAWQTWIIGSSLLEARQELRELVDRVDAQDPEGATEAARRADDATSRADFHSHTPVWWLAQYLPVVGDDVEAVRVVSSAAHDLTEGVVSPLAEAGLTPDQFKPQDGRLPIEPVRRAAGVLDEAAPRVADAEESAGDLETSGLVAPLRGPVVELQSMLGDASRVTRAAAIAADLLPSMLGGEGERRYLVAFQNNAEVRATGGMPGSLVTLTARDGRLEMGRSLTPAAFEGNGRIVEPTPAELELFQPRYFVSGRPTFNPDFPRNSELYEAWWKTTGRDPIDGVITIDPVALSYLLDYTGPITLRDGQVLTRANTVDVMLRDSYANLSIQEQDKFFADAARTIFDTMIQADGSAADLVAALSRGIDERRVAVWSARPEEQDRLAGEDIAAELPQETGRPEIGFYVNGEKGDKLGYYLHVDTAVTPGPCDEEDQRMVVDVTMRSSAPATGLPDYVYGDRLPGLPAAGMRNRVYLYAPTGGRVDALTVDGEEVAVTRVVQGTRPVAFTTLDLRPGATVKLQYAVSAPREDGDVRVLSTPLADGTGGESFVDSACG